MTDSEIAEQAVRKIHEAWLAAEVAGNTAAVLALCTGDVRWMAPGMAPVQGQEAGRRLLSCTGGSVVRIEVSDVRCEVSDTLAIKTARFRTHVRKAGKPAPEVVTGTHLWVLRREDAHWRVALVTWQLEGATERRASA